MSGRKDAVKGLLYGGISSEIHIKLTLNHTVVEFTAFFCLSAEKLLKLFMRGYDVTLHISAFSEDFSHNFVYVFGFTKFEKSFTVGGIADDG